MKYIVKGTTRGLPGRTAYSFRLHGSDPKFITVMKFPLDPDDYFADKGTSYYDTIKDACEAYRAMGGLDNVLICAVGESGNQYPMMTYEEAMEEVCALRELLGNKESEHACRRQYSKQHCRDWPEMMHCEHDSK